MSSKAAELQGRRCWLGGQDIPRLMAQQAAACRGAQSPSTGLGLHPGQVIVLWARAGMLKNGRHAHVGSKNAMVRSAHLISSVG